MIKVSEVPKHKPPNDVISNNVLILPKCNFCLVHSNVYVMCIVYFISLQSKPVIGLIYIYICVNICDIVTIVTNTPVHNVRIEGD